MSFDDPFDAPQEAQAEVAPVAAPVAATPEVVGDEKVRITLKSGATYDAPWVTVDFPSIDVAHARLSDLDRQKKLADIFDIASKASGKFQALVGASPAGARQGSNAPAAAQEAPSWAPEKPYADFIYKSGVSKKNGSTWHAWMPPQQGDSRKALFFNAPR